MPSGYPGSLALKWVMSSNQLGEGWSPAAFKEAPLLGLPSGEDGKVLGGA
jgi:hypothetical protein